MKMKKKIYNILHTKLTKRVVCGMTSLVMIFGVAPLDQIGNEFNEFMSRPLYVSAEGEEYAFPHNNETEKKVEIYLEQLVDYSEDCAKYRAYHQYDNLVIKNGGTTEIFNPGFKGLGSLNYPFGGSVKINSDAMKDRVLNLDAPLFNYVYDDITIENTYGTNRALKIARAYNAETIVGSNAISTRTPLLADHVVHRGSGGAVWNIAICDPSSDDSAAQFGGIIGSLDENSTIVTVNAYLSTSSPVTIAGDKNLGFACGAMDSGTKLTFTLSIVEGSGVGSVSTTSGNVGGLVGSMVSTSEFSYNGINPQADNAVISTSSGYAGGVVGFNSEGKVSLNSFYTIKQYITGTSGAGGVYGYYKPSADLDLNIQNYSIDCQVNGSGCDGGLFGVLENGGHTLGISSVTATENTLFTYLAGNSVAETEETIINSESAEDNSEKNVFSSDASEIYESEATGHDSDISGSDNHKADTLSETKEEKVESSNLSEENNEGKSTYEEVKSSEEDIDSLSSDDESLETDSEAMEEDDAEDYAIFFSNRSLNAAPSVVVKSNHASGSASAYGGLIGKYIPNSDISKTLTITNVQVNTSKSGGSATSYGGGIGLIDSNNKSYVEFNGFNTNSSNTGTLTYGGLVASADKAFVHADGVTVIANGHKGGAFVGSLANGVLQISGDNTMEDAVSAAPGTDDDPTKIGRYVGYRDNGLVFMDTDATAVCGAAEVDDIGSWGVVLRLSAFSTPAR